LHIIDYLVLFLYFASMTIIGLWSMRKIKVQEDFFMGGRGFGKLMQTFAAFGAGTNASGPVVAASTTFTSGMSGMWSVMYWLFVTPVYWFSGVWYRRMRCLTMGDFFVERYESKALGAAYAVFGVLYYIIYSSMAFAAIGKIAATLIGQDTVSLLGWSGGLEYVLVPVIGFIVLAYGLAGGLQAAYYTDLIQGLCIILLSIILIPFGLDAVVERFGEPNASIMSGFEIIHQQLPPEHFQLVGNNTSEFPLHRILAVVLINLVGIVVTPHMIVTGGGSAKTESNARVGLVTGNLLKRLCTIGWVLTALIALALFADDPNLVADPDKTWGIASRELLGPGLTGLMLACLLAALMSSVDAYMLVSAALVVRNVYVTYIDPDADEKKCIYAARLTGAAVVMGAIVVALNFMNVFQQLQLTWVFPILFAAVFWFGLYWRRATTMAAWGTIGFVALLFFVLPALIPRVTDFATRAEYLVQNQLVQTTTSRAAAPSDVSKRRAEIEAWRAANPNGQASDEPLPLAVGDTIFETTTSGGQSIFWSQGVKPVDAAGTPISVELVPEGDPEQVDDNVTRQTLGWPEGTTLRGFGNFRVEFLLYQPWLDMTKLSSAMLNTLELPLKIVLPFAVMWGLSLVTARNSRTTLDRFYAKMKCPVDPDHETDLQNLEAAQDDYSKLEHRKLFPRSDIEVEKPTRADVVGGLATLGACIGVVLLALFVAQLGA